MERRELFDAYFESYPFLVGIALIAGIVTWLSRRGGCTSRTRPRTKDGFEHQPEDDFALNMSDTPIYPGGAAAAPPQSPFQNQARRFVPPSHSAAGAGYDQSGGYVSDGYYYQNNIAAAQQHAYYQPQLAPHRDNMKPDEVIEHKPNVA